MQEKRQHERCKGQLKVHYSCARGPLIVEADSESKDISAGGIRMPLDDILTVADRVKLAINLPWQKHPLDAVAKIVWVSPKLVTGDLSIQRDCGLQFLWTSAQNLRELIKSNRN